MKSKKGVPIVPSSGLYYCDYHNTDAARFVRVFRETWKAIPSRDRKATVKHWQDGETPALPGYLASKRAAGCTMPLITVEWSRSSHRGIDAHNSLAMYKPHEQSFLFAAAAVNAMPDEILREVIAHELAHAFIYATVEDAFEAEHTEPDDELHVFDWHECEAREQMEYWGFDDDLIDQWLHAGGRAEIERLRTEFWQRLDAE